MNPQQMKYILDAIKASEQRTRDDILAALALLTERLIALDDVLQPKGKAVSNGIQPQQMDTPPNPAGRAADHGVVRLRKPLKSGATAPTPTTVSGGEVPAADIDKGADAPKGDSTNE